MSTLYKEIRQEFPVFNDDSYDISPLKWKEFLKTKGGSTIRPTHGP
jgi:hypothetical protein